jgi:hypothetical protein
MKLELSRQIFEKFSNIKFRENSSSEGRFFQFWRTDGRKEAWTDMMNPTVAFRNFAKAPNNDFVGGIIRSV